MSIWEHHLNLKDLWEQSEIITIQELSKKVAERIEQQLFYDKYQEDLEPIVEAFKDLSDDSGLTVDDFDTILSDLYDWGDMDLPTLHGQMQRKMCWIATF